MREPTATTRIARSNRVFSYSAEHAPCARIEPGEWVVVLRSRRDRLPFGEAEQARATDTSDG